MMKRSLLLLMPIVCGCTPSALIPANDTTFARCEA